MVKVRVITRLKVKMLKSLLSKIFHFHEWGQEHYFGDIKGFWNTYKVFRRWCKTCGECEVICKDLY